jgi:dienelactone hydrolase
MVPGTSAESTAERGVVSFVRRHWKRGLVVAIVTVLLVTGFGLQLALTYFSHPFHGTDASIQGVEADPAIELEWLGNGYVLRPANHDSETGLVFYPGGRVHPDAYLATLAPLVREANVTVFVPRMPLNLAVLNPNAARPVVRNNPGIDTWYVGGHSLGGAMACRYATGTPYRVEGLVLLASYCDRDASDTSLRVLSVTGTADGVLNRDRYRATRSNLPPDARFVRIRGMNHSQFGTYRGQLDDAPATIDDETAHHRLGTVLVSWFENETGVSANVTARRASAIRGDSRRSEATRGDPRRSDVFDTVSNRDRRECSLRYPFSLPVLRGG